MPPKVILLPKALSALRVVRLPHPRTNALSSFVVSGADIYEVLEATRGGRASFFIGDTVASDGAALVLARVHPVFLLLPLASSRGRDELFRADEYFAGTPLECVGAQLQPHLSAVCSFVRYGDMDVCFYDDAKAMQWLSAKCAALQRVLAPAERAWDVLRHYLRPGAAERLRAHIITAAPPQSAAAPQRRTVRRRSPAIGALDAFVVREKIRR